MKNPKAKNPRGKETSTRVGSAAGRLLALKRKYPRGWFWFTSSSNFTTSYFATTVSRDVLACAGSAHVQRQIPKPKKRKAKVR